MKTLGKITEDMMSLHSAIEEFCKKRGHDCLDCPFDKEYETACHKHVLEANIASLQKDVVVFK